MDEISGWIAFQKAAKCVKILCTVFKDEIYTQGASS